MRHLHLLAALALTVGCGASSAAEPAPERAPGGAAASCGAASAYEGGRMLTMPDGAQVFVRELGDLEANPVLFVHGGPGYNGFVLERSLGPRLGEGIRLVSVDQRGCGRSAAGPDELALGMSPTLDDFERVREALGVDRWSLVIGHSFGGLIAAELARAHPERVAALMLVETAPSFPLAFEHQVASARAVAPQQWPQLAPRVEEAATGEASALERLFAIYGIVGRAPVQRALHWAGAEAQERADALDEGSGLAACTRPGVMRAYHDQGFLGDRPTGGALPVPGILYGGRASHVIGEAVLRAAAEGWQVELRWFDASGHFPYVEEPEAFAAAARELAGAAR